MSSFRAVSLRLLSFAAATPLLAAFTCNKPDYPACDGDKHCNIERGESCVDGVCQNCKADADCTELGGDGAAWVCHRWRCSDPKDAAAAISEARGHGNEGEVCAMPTDCFGGLSCQAGKCSKCGQDSDCSRGACTVKTGRCTTMEECSADAHCPSGQSCDDGLCIYTETAAAQQGVACGLSPIYFSHDSDRVAPKMLKKLEALTPCIIEQNRPLQIEGYADNAGPEQYSQLLGTARATAVREELVGLGVNGDLLEAVGKGKVGAGTSSADSERAKDRRVELVWKNTDDEDLVMEGEK